MSITFTIVRKKIWQNFTWKPVRDAKQLPGQKLTRMLLPIVFLLHLVLGWASGEANKTKSDDQKYISGNNTDLEAALEFLERFEAQSIEVGNALSIATWNYNTNLTEYNRDFMIQEQAVEANFTKLMWEEVTSFAWKLFEGKNDTVYRAFKSLSILGSAALTTEKLNQLNMIVADMTDIFSTAKVCPYNNTGNLPCNLALEPDLTDFLKKPGDYEELAHYWVTFREVTGKKIKEKYLKLIELSNESARLNGFEDEGEFRRWSFESETFETNVENLWQTMKPFYQQLHAYVRRKLMQTYPGRIQPDGPIPAHLFGNMWSQSWGNIIGLVNPYPEKAPIDVTDFMVEKNMTALEMFKTAEQFFVSLGLKPMPQKFWDKSVIERPKDREIVCHASASDMYIKDDVRIKMCTIVNEEDLITIHHEMGHIQYYLQYANQPTVFRNGANDGFHEAIGDTLSLSVSTPKHLHEIGLLQKPEDDYELDINFQMSMALNKIAFLPFGYLMDAYRWDLFDGDIGPDEMNTKWWEYRLRYQGICPPVVRDDSFFDAGAKYHTAADVPYIRYFVSFVIQFQFHKALCNASGFEGPLHKCDIYRSKEAGKLMSDMLSLGSSVHWGEAMKVITQGQTSKMDAGPLLEYFSPLRSWLEQENQGEYIGWNSDNPLVCP